MPNLKFKSLFAHSILVLLAAFTLTACNDDGDSSSDNSTTPTTSVESVLKTNADIAHASYLDSLTTAQALKTAIDAFVAAPSQATQDAAKAAWLASREPYGQTEVYRFRLGPIDSTDGVNEDGPEGQINAWPLGEKLVDYVAGNVDGDDGPENASATTIAPSIIEDLNNVPVIDKTVIAGLNNNGDDERNVATGYHAIEFLLWGQDQNTADQSSTAGWNGTDARDTSGGHRPFTDYSLDPAVCTHGADHAVAGDFTFCQRRGAYLTAAAELLIDDLQGMVTAWDPAGNGNHYDTFIAGDNASLAKILEGMGRLSFGELAGERINIALTTNSQEDEHSCFSDNTHRDIYLNAQGVENSFLGRYTRVDGTVLDADGIDDLLRAQNQSALADQLTTELADTMAKAKVISDEAVAGTPFDTQIERGGINDPEIKAVIAALVTQTATIQKVIEALNLTAGNLEQDTEENIK